MMKKVFISYRNTVENNIFVNVSILEDLIKNLEKDKKTKCISIAPELLPYGTLFSPYDIAVFLQKTFTLLDDCEKFYIIWKDYFSPDGELTSIWTEAEFYMWSYYSRTMFLSKHRKKDAFYTCFQNGEFAELPLINLSKYQRSLLRICALDFDPTSRINYSWPYLKRGKQLLVVCPKCKKVHLLEKSKILPQHSFVFACKKCGNNMVFFKHSSNYICSSQNINNNYNKQLNIFDCLSLLVNDNPSYEEIDTLEQFSSI